MEGVDRTVEEALARREAGRREGFGQPQKRSVRSMVAVDMDVDGVPTRYLPGGGREEVKPE